MTSRISTIRYLLSLIAGATVTLGFSPFDFWPVPMLAIVLVFLLIRNTDFKSAALCGFLFGIGMFGAGTSWVYVSIHEFGAASVPLAGFLTLLFILALSALMIMPLFMIYSWITIKRPALAPWQQALVFAGLWVIFEWVRSWLLTGFPWLLLGYSLLDTPFQSFAPLTGTYGLSLLMVTTACLCGAACIPAKEKNRSGLIILFIVAALWGSAWPLGNIQWTEKTGTLEFSAVQGNIPQNSKWDPDYIQTTVDTFINLSTESWDKDLIIWPENAIPMFYNRSRGFMEQLDRNAKKQATSLILGVPIDDNSGDQTRYYNGLVSLGQGEGQYFKQKLVPFGEYVPMQSLLRGLIDFFNLPMSDFSRGSENQSPLKAGDVAIAPFICYEVVYPDFAARNARNTGLLVTVSNDTWFGKSIGPEQHFQMARMRSLETGRYMIRATNDGITALIDTRGNVLDSIPRFEKGVLNGSAMIMAGNTPFMMFGSWPILILAFVMIGLGAIRFRRS